MSRMTEEQKKIMKNEMEELLKDIEMFESKLDELEKKESIYEEKMAVKTFEENIKIMREELENFWDRYKNVLGDYELRKQFGEDFFPQLDKIIERLEGFEHYYSLEPETEIMMKELSSTLKRILYKVKIFLKNTSI